MSYDVIQYKATAIAAKTEKKAIRIEDEAKGRRERADEDDPLFWETTTRTLGS